MQGPDNSRQTTGNVIFEDFWTFQFGVFFFFFFKQLSAEAVNVQNSRVEL